ncbi:MAG TPA: polysaccharide deacetylase family protein, partial [Erysipelothrix sp.]|nr:polysaccharide deacetylase family protein [Erysipelothrix sp.]
VEKLYEIDLSKLEKGHNQLDVVKENLNTQVKHFREASKTLNSQFEYALEVIEIASEEDPSIQDFQTAFFSLNDDSKALHLILSTIKENSQQLYDSIKAWNLVFDISDDKTVDNNVNTDDPIDLKPPFSITRYTLDKNYYIKPIDDANEKIVLLTFDDCVQPEPNSYTLDIAKTLKEKGVSAIFFFNGMFLESQYAKDVLKEVYDMGFVIGNHTYSHPYLNKLNYEQTQAEIVSTSDLIEEVIGVRPKMFRPSFGILGDYGAQVVEEEGMLSMNWTYGYDWEAQYMEAEPLADIMVNTPYLTSGANLLMHDRKWTAAAIGDIIDGLIEKGYEIVDPSEILVPGDN